MGKKKRTKKPSDQLKKRGRQGEFTTEQEQFLTSLIPAFRTTQATQTYRDFWASTHAEWSKRWTRLELTEEEIERGVTDADKAIKELKVSHNCISYVTHYSHIVRRKLKSGITIMAVKYQIRRGRMC
jgi:hypothetical protein